MRRGPASRIQSQRPMSSATIRKFRAWRLPQAESDCTVLGENSDAATAKAKKHEPVHSIRSFALHVGLDRKSHCQSVSVWILRNSSHDPLPCFGSGFFSNQLIAASSPVSRQILRNRIAAPSGRRYAQGKIAIKKLPLQTRRARQSAIILQSTLRNYGSPSFTAVSALGLIVLSQWTPESVDGHTVRHLFSRRSNEA